VHIAFRFGTFEQEDLVLRNVADAAYGLYASRDYLERPVDQLPCDDASGLSGKRRRRSRRDPQVCAGGP
jgi:hypothetical protein